MSQEIEFELDEETETFHILLDGEDQGPVDTESLRKTAGKLHMHFTMFKEPPEPPENQNIEEDTQTLSDEEIEEELKDLEDELDEIED